VAKRVKNHPSTPIQGYSRSAKKPAAAEETPKEDLIVDGTKLRTAILALLDEFKATKPKQEAKDKLITDGVAALRAEIAALRADNATLNKELREVSKELKALTTSSNTMTDAGAAAGLRETPLQTQRGVPQSLTTQTGTGRLQYQERTVVTRLGKAASEVTGKSTERLKEIAQKELQKEESTKAVQVIAVSAPTQGRLEIITGSKVQAQAARENKRWVRRFGEGAKPKEATWFPLKVDGVDRKDPMQGRRDRVGF
jgi:hypothetical protein